MSSKLSMSIKQWLTLLAICMAGGVIFKLAYLRDVFYVPMGEAFNANHTELGLMMTAFAVTQFIAYLPGGWLVDFISVKKLVPASLISTGLLGFWLATYPSFKIVLVIQACFGVTITLLFWEAMIKGVRMLGTPNQQGRLFGLLEGGRGLFSTIVSFAALFVFERFGEGRLGLRATMIFYSITLVVLGIVTYFLIEENESEGHLDAKGALKGLLEVAKLPKVWLAGAIVFFGYSFYNGLGYLTPYLTDIYGISVSLGATLSIVRTYLIAFIAAPIGGMIADKMGSRINYLKYALLTGAALTMVYFFIPENSGIAIPVAIMLILAVVIMTIRGTYYSTGDEIGVPMVLAGSTAGIMSIVGNTPDLFVFALYGNMVDKYPGVEGYNKIFAIMIGFALAGVICAILLARIVKKEKQNK